MRKVNKRKKRLIYRIRKDRAKINTGTRVINPKKRYNRNKMKEELRKMLREEGINE